MDRTLLLGLSGILLAGLLFSTPAGAKETEKAQATFIVHCYDVGVQTLQGKPGVLSVKPGWLGSNEVDRVVYNADTVQVEQLEIWLKEAGTYVRTVDEVTPKHGE